MLRPAKEIQMSNMRNAIVSHRHSAPPLQHPLIIPSCSIPCFKQHKVTHTDTAPTSPTTTLNLPNPPPPKPLPKYLRSRIDFSQLATNPKFRDLLNRHTSLLPTLQRIYAATIEPDPDEVRSQRAVQTWRGRGRGSRGRGFGRGGFGGGRGARGGRDEPPKWTQKKGDGDALRGLKRIREGGNGDGEREGIGEFVRLVEEMFGEKETGTGRASDGNVIHTS
jgi:hypothetical protein